MSGFLVFLEVGRDTSCGDLVILHRFPDNFGERPAEGELLERILEFAGASFQTKVDERGFPVGSRFAFGLCTSVQVGDEDVDPFVTVYCRTGRTMLLIASPHQWFKSFYDLLENINYTLNTSEDSHIDATLLSCHRGVRLKQAILTGQSVDVYFPKTTQSVRFGPPLDDQLQSDINMIELRVSMVDNNHLITIFAAVLQELNIFVVSHDVARLTKGAFAIQSLLFPINWQHAFFPLILPTSTVFTEDRLEHFSEVGGTGMGGIFGVRRDVFEKYFLDKITEPACIVWLDNNRVEERHCDAVSALPSEILSFLRTRLAKEVTDNTNRSFAIAMSALLNRPPYKHALEQQKNGGYVFNTQLFSERAEHKCILVAKLKEYQWFAEWVHEVEMAASTTGVSSLPLLPQLGLLDRLVDQFHTSRADQAQQSITRVSGVVANRFKQLTEALDGTATTAKSKVKKVIKQTNSRSGRSPAADTQPVTPVKKYQELDPDDFMSPESHPSPRLVEPSPLDSGVESPADPEPTAASSCLIDFGDSDDEWLGTPKAKHVISAANPKVKATVDFFDSLATSTGGHSWLPGSRSTSRSTWQTFG